MKERKHSWSILLVGIITIAALAGCTQTAAETPTVAVTPTQETEVLLPSATPEVVEQPGVVILLAAGGADQARVAEVSPLVQEAATRHSLTFEQRDTLALETVPENLRLVVSLPPADNLQTLIDGLPQVQFVVLDTANVTIQPNVSALPGGSGSTNIAFTAGYIAAVESNEYRVGIISTSSAEGQLYRQAFMNGVLYFCGTCLPIYPPYEIYPVYAEVSPDASPEQINVAAQSLQAKQVQIVHLDPQLESEPVLQMLAQGGFFLIGSSAPPSGLEGSWVASVLAESGVGLADILERALNGQAVGLQAVRPVINFTGVSEARLANFNEIIEMLESEAIDPIGNVN